ncbi:MAG: dicarboxylate/amino acid:cation symporter [Geminocystis sp.]|nr:dicarboxylate/amino acid:cation symporter [Geminocystis sp.]MCS7148584.1 dicarboxylate/amino acid:cation symporter [Geminocystis sp.]MDW8115024.1 dicarboxylate/amino acid:cation symporter [Geminocystis sp.]MDW8464292.1 dicarboxylate/amino acid:cation symporter [Geminocystis sp.]
MTRNNNSYEFSWNYFVSLFTGITLGIILGGFMPKLGQEVKFLGELFINTLLMLVVPLVMISMITSITSLGDLRQLRGLGYKTIFFYMITTAVAVILGLILVNVIQPGVADTEAERLKIRGGELLADVEYFVNDNKVTIFGGEFKSSWDERYFVLLTDQNITGNISEKIKTNSQTIVVDGWRDARGETVKPSPQGKGIKIDLTVTKKLEEKKETTVAETLKQVIVGLLPRNIFQAMAENDVLPLIVFSLLFGGVLTTVEGGRIIIDFCSTLNTVILKIVDIILLFAPLGICALVAGRLGEAGGWSGFTTDLIFLGRYVFTVFFGLLIHGIVILPLFLYTITKKSPWRYLRRSFPCLMTAFATASSSATIPVTLECVIKNNRVDSRIADFVIPLGATINMDGTALYEAVAAVFIAQIYGIELGLAEAVIVFFTATLAAIGAAGIPEAGLVTMVMVLKAVNLPVEGISLILVIDWFLDRCRTTINVWGDCVVAGIIDSLEKKDSQ